jgi:hypothetical protein
VPFTIHPLPPGVRITIVVISFALLVTAVVIAHRGAILLAATSDAEFTHQPVHKG